MHHRSHDQHGGGVDFSACITGHITGGSCIQRESRKAGGTILLEYFRVATVLNANISKFQFSEFLDVQAHLAWVECDLV